MFEEFIKVKTSHRKDITEIDKEIICWLVKSGVNYNKISKFTKLKISPHTIKKIAPREKINLTPTKP